MSDMIQEAFSCTSNDHGLMNKSCFSFCGFEKGEGNGESLESEPPNCWSVRFPVFARENWVPGNFSHNNFWGPIIDYEGMQNISQVKYLSFFPWPFTRKCKDFFIIPVHPFLRDSTKSSMTKYLQWWFRHGCFQNFGFSFASKNFNSPKAVLIIPISTRFLESFMSSNHSFLEDWVIFCASFYPYWTFLMSHMYTHT